MHAPFRLVASDIDGTLIRGDGSLSPRTIDVLDRLQDRGVPTVLVTGRPVRWLRQLYDQMAEPLPAVCANGAVVYDPDTDEILRAAPLDVDLLQDVTKQLRAAVPDVTLAVEVEDGRSFWYEEKWPLNWDGEHKNVRVLAAPEELTSVPAVKLLARSARHEPDEFADGDLGAFDNGTLTPALSRSTGRGSGRREIFAQVRELGRELCRPRRAFT